MVTSADELIVGAIDLHCHHGPDPHRERSVDAAEAVREATEEPETFAHAMMTVGPERAVMSTDFGQKKSPHPAEGMRLFIDEMLRCGVPASAVDAMARTNPARLLGLA